MSNSARTQHARDALQMRLSTGPSARQTFAQRQMVHAMTIRSLKLTTPQRRALDAIAEHHTAPIHPGSIVTDRMFSTLEGHGLVRSDPARPHRAALTDLGMAYARRTPRTAAKGGRK
ncbi:MAG: hypothetical protein K0S70_66 [Microbacterium sp.]|jgi:hypothetical protein|nr:hypothetical protein [Microbacterium sp.]